jgi:OOP family OmpA-OmpF porin
MSTGTNFVHLIPAQPANAPACPERHSIDSQAGPAQAPRDTFRPSALMLPLLNQLTQGSMKKTTIITALLATSLTAAFSQQDAEGTKDHPMFPNRMSNYFISESNSNFDAVEFNLAAGGSKSISKEGTKTLVRYDFNAGSGQSKPSALQILRNYEAAAKKISGETLFLSAGEGLATFKIMKNASEVWIKIETGGDGNNDFYYLTILEIEPMKQEITSNDILTALNTDGHIALYINFETGKSDIKQESQKIIDQVVEMLRSNPTLRISTEGHTDNVGNSQSNQTLSENRAKAVTNVIISKGIDKTRLLSKGWGQTKPIEDNKTEDGKAKNRRVEIVKL